MSAAHQPKTKPTILDRYTQKQISFRVSWLIGKYGFTSSDLTDLQQEVTLHVLKWLPRYDDKKSKLRTYIDRILDGKLANIIRRREIRTRRGNAEVLSIEVARDSEETPGTKPSHELVPDADRYEIGIGRRNLSRQAQAELRLDIETMLSMLPPRLRLVCTKLMHKDKTTVAHEMGMSLNTFKYKVLSPLREAFKDAGFEEIPLDSSQSETTCG